MINCSDWTKALSPSSAKPHGSRAFFALLIFVGISFGGTSLILSKGLLQHREQVAQFEVMKETAAEWNSNRSYFSFYARNQSVARLTSRDLTLLAGYFYLDLVEMNDADPTPNFEAAALEFEQQLADTPGNELAWAGLGLARAGLGDSEGASTALSNAHLLGPQNSRVRWPRAALSALLWPNLEEPARGAALDDIVFLWQMEDYRRLAETLRHLPSGGIQQVSDRLRQNDLDYQRFETLAARVTRDN